MLEQSQSCGSRFIAASPVDKSQPVDHLPPEHHVVGDAQVRDHRELLVDRGDSRKPGLLRILGPPGVITGGEARFQGRDLLALDPEALESVRWRQASIVLQSALDADSSTSTPLRFL